MLFIIKGCLVLLTMMPTLLSKANSVSRWILDDQGIPEYFRYKTVILLPLQ
jgi:hypothetical protein